MSNVNDLIGDIVLGSELLVGRAVGVVKITFVSGRSLILPGCEVYDAPVTLVIEAQEQAGKPHGRHRS